MPCFGCCNVSTNGRDMEDAIEKLEDIDLETLHRRTSSIETDSSKRWESRILPAFRAERGETSSVPVQRKRCCSLDAYDSSRKYDTWNPTRPSESKIRREKFQKSNSIH